MNSKAVIVLGIVATFTIMLIAGIGVGYGSNNYLFQDGSTPLTGNWNIGSSYILNQTMENWLHMEIDGGVDREHVFHLEANCTSQDRRITHLLFDAHPSPGANEWLNISVSDGTNFMWVNMTGADEHNCTTVGAFDLDVSLEDLTINLNSTAGILTEHVNVIVQWYYKENE